jgi:hypothetical protein
MVVYFSSVAIAWFPAVWTLRRFIRPQIVETVFGAGLVAVAWPLTLPVLLISAVRAGRKHVPGEASGRPQLVVVAGGR